MDGWIRFMAPVVNSTADALIRAIDQKLSKNIDRLHVMLSSPGGSVFHGLSIHNLLRGSPVPVSTYNFGSVDSIGVVIFCAGSERVCVPHARFLVHGVTLGLQAGSAFDEKQLEEQIKLLRSDYGNISRVIADTSGKSKKDVVKMMNQRTTLSPDEAKAIGLVTDIRSQLFPEGADMTMIYENGAMQELTLAPRQLPLTRQADGPGQFTEAITPASLIGMSPNIPSSCSIPVETGTYFSWQQNAVVKGEEAK
jgi:ATP-dependent Clp protease, protease subunit